jgi:hypothetical protein
VLQQLLGFLQQVCLGAQQLRVPQQLGVPQQPAPHGISCASSGELASITIKTAAEWPKLRAAPNLVKASMPISLSERMRSIVAEIGCPQVVTKAINQQVWQKHY